MSFVDNLRKYRFVFENPAFNDRGNGIAIFDVVATFLVAYILKPFVNKFFTISDSVYYLLLIPFSVLFHKALKIDTFLNRQIFNSQTFNVYKKVVGSMVLLAIYFQNCSSNPPPYTI